MNNPRQPIGLFNKSKPEEKKEDQSNIINKFQYKDICTGKFLSYKGFMSMDTRDTPGYAHFGFPEASDPNAQKHGWKMHISVNDNDIENAWNAILPILIHYKIPVCKFVMPHNKKASKAFVIYQNFSKNTDWEAFANDISASLIVHNIQPGPQDLMSCKKINEFLHYRNDRRIDNGKYLEAGANISYNPGYKDDPNENIIINKRTVDQPTQSDLMQQQLRLLKSKMRK